MARAASYRIKLQLFSGGEIAMGPGKADLLEAIQSTGSISAAGRALGMSYRRTWLLVDTMNRCWAAPLVETATGGSHGGGAMVTELGRQVLDQYRALCREAEKAAESGAFSQLQTHLLKVPKQQQDSSDT